MTEEIHRIDKEVAELKGTILVEIRHLGHDIKNMMQAMGAFVPRPEVERMLADARARIDDIKKELLEKVEALDAKQDKRHDGAEADRKTIRNILFSSIAMGAVGWGFWFLKH